MPQSMSSLNEKFWNYPIEVNFAGFRSNTLKLQENGWQLSMDQRMSASSADFEMTLALKHEAARVYAMANPLRLDSAAIYSAQFDTEKYITYLKYLCFDICYMGATILIQPYKMPPTGFGFKPIDARPSYEQEERKSLEDLSIFRPLNPSVEVVVEQSSVAELLELIAKKQAPSQAELRERLRKEKMRGSMDAQKYTGKLLGYDPIKDIKAQLVCVS